MSEFAEVFVGSGGECMRSGEKCMGVSRERVGCGEERMENSWEHVGNGMCMRLNEMIEGSEENGGR